MKIHFIGIGGIGVSALANYYLAQHYSVSGSDLVSSEITDSLRLKGAEIAIGEHRPENIPQGTETVIYSPAIEKTNPELKEAKKRKIKCLSYPQALGKLTKQYFTIAVCGTHGKSTTTAMLALALLSSLDPTVIVGTKLKEFGDSNCHIGKSRYLVIEADEHMASFLNYWPKITILTRLEADHLDYYKNLKNIFLAFRKFINHLPKDGVLIANSDDVNIKKLLRVISNKTINPKFKIIKYSLKNQEAEKIQKVLNVPGEHNVSNALAVLEAARALKVPDSDTFKALGRYTGAWRRFEVFKAKINRKPVTIVSDYGHHPTELAVTLKAAREKYPRNKIWCVFQPHQYQRTYYLFKEFVKALSEASVDRLIVTDIYSVAGRESDKIKKLVNSEKLVAKIKEKNPQKDVLCLPTLETVKLYLEENISGKEVVVLMGAGDIYNLTVALTK